MPIERRPAAYAIMALMALFLLSQSLTHKIAEANNVAEEAQSAAEDAKSTAEEAQSAAEEAQNAADEAQNTAELNRY